MSRARWCAEAPELRARATARPGWWLLVGGSLAASSCTTTTPAEHVGSSRQALLTTVIDLPTQSLGVPESELSYVVGVGDLDGDGASDFLVRVWKDDPLVDSFPTVTYAFASDGAALWSFAHDISYGDVSFDPTSTVSLSAWDLDGDGRDEVVTERKVGGDFELVVLDGLDGQVLRSTSLGPVKKLLHAAVAYLDGAHPSIVITHGNPMVTRAFDSDLNPLWQLDGGGYGAMHDTCFTRAHDVDGDGRDEIVRGALLIDDDGTVLLDATSFDAPAVGFTERSFIADIDPQNPGLEWYLLRAGKDPGQGYFVQPASWKGPWLIDVDQQSVLWHHTLTGGGQGWGRLHRGWVGDVQASVPGLEMLATGYLWQGSEWQDALDGVYQITPDGVWAGGYWETYVLFGADGSILSQSTGTHVGYPVHWDDDDNEEYFRYRSGILEDHYGGSALESGLAQAYGSGESVEADIMGDWREEVLVASGFSLYIYGDDSPGAHPDRPTPRALRDYRLNLASVGTGLPKPLPFTLSQLDALAPGSGPWPQGGGGAGAGGAAGSGGGVSSSGAGGQAVGGAPSSSGEAGGGSSPAAGPEAEPGGCGCRVPAAPAPPEPAAAWLLMLLVGALPAARSWSAVRDRGA